MLGSLVFVMSGVSGSGKSTLAHSIRTWVCTEAREEVPFKIVSADNYFTDEKGKYLFDPSKVTQAHAQCLRQYTEILCADTPEATPGVLIVDNTSLTNWERAPYMALAHAYAWDAYIIQLDVPPDIAARRTTHGVPEGTVYRMWEKRERPLPWWKVFTPDLNETSVAQARNILESVGFLKKL